MALSKVRAECNKVTTMSLFHSSLSKSSRLEEFEQIQSQTFSQVRGQQAQGTAARDLQLTGTGQGPQLDLKSGPAPPRPCGRWGGCLGVAHRRRGRPGRLPSQSLSVQPWWALKQTPCLRKGSRSPMCGTTT